MKPENGRLVSFCVKCFNQERYIGEALKGAFAQTYRPLEIVVSDDASTDRSWDVIEAAVAEYRRRPDAAVVVLNRNARNLGNLGNWLAICSLAKGELLVKADGDDVSMPDRTERIVNAWTDDGCRATAVSHGGTFMGPRGQHMGAMRAPSAESPVGAAMAFARSTYESFGGACDLRIVDDELFAWRARMLGPELVIPDRLVMYRLGTGISNSLWGMREPMVRCRHGYLTTLRQVRLDLERFGASMSVEERGRWASRIDDAENRVKSELMLMDGETLAVRRAGFRIVGRKRLSAIWQFFRIAFLMPRPLGNAMLFFYAAVRYAARRISGMCATE